MVCSSVDLTFPSLALTVVVIVAVAPTSVSVLFLVNRVLLLKNATFIGWVHNDTGASFGWGVKRYCVSCGPVPHAVKPYPMRHPDPNCDRLLDLVGAVLDGKGMISEYGIQSTFLKDRFR